MQRPKGVGEGVGGWGGTNLEMLQLQHQDIELAPLVIDLRLSLPLLLQDNNQTERDETR